MGWRARYVVALNPLSLELTVDHPLLASNSELMSSTDCYGSLDQSNNKRVTKVPNEKEPNTNTDNATMSETCLSWIEVLCGNDDSKLSNDDKRKPKSTPKQLVARWIPVFPEQETVDKPEEVESILAWIRDITTESSPSKKTTQTKKKSTRSNIARKSLRRQSSNSYAKKAPVSYVLATEHFPPIMKSTTTPFDVSSKSLRGARFTDVTPRYANTWSRTLRLRGATARQLKAGGGKCVDEWWATSLKDINGMCSSAKNKSSLALANDVVNTEPEIRVSVTKTVSGSGKEVEVLEIDSSGDEKPAAMDTNNDSGASDHDEHDNDESVELTKTTAKEAIPTSKKAFRENPFYVIPSVLNSQDVLHPDAHKRICGVFKGELVYKRSDVSKALRAKKWLYEGRKVKENEIPTPAKQINARKKPTSQGQGFKALESYVTETTLPSKYSEAGDGNAMENLYGIWQTAPWYPPHVGPSDPIPTNEFKNVELALLNPGLVHLDLPRISSLARKICIPYAPCMLGFEGRRGNRAPSIRGIVVHSHNVELLREAHIEWESHAVEAEVEARQKENLKRWKRLVVGIMTKDRLDKEYG